MSYWEKIDYYRQKRKEAASLLEEAETLEAIIRLAREYSDEKLLLEMLTEYGGVIKYLGRYSEAEAAFSEVRTRLESGALAETSAYVNCLVNLANLYRMMGRVDDSEALFQKAISMSEHIFDAESRASMLNNLALLYQEQGRYSEAMELHKKNLEDESLAQRPAYQKGSTFNNIAALNIHMKKYEDAVEAAEEAVRCYQMLEPGDPLRLTALNTLAAAQCCAGHFATALATLREIEPLCRIAYGEESPSYQSVCRSIARIEMMNTTGAS